MEAVCSGNTIWIFVDQHGCSEEPYALATLTLLSSQKWVLKETVPRSMASPAHERGVLLDFVTAAAKNSAT